MMWRFHVALDVADVVEEDIPLAADKFSDNVNTLDWVRYEK
jgi:hypothetical protein